MSCAKAGHKRPMCWEWWPCTHVLTLLPLPRAVGWTLHLYTSFPSKEIVNQTIMKETKQNSFNGKITSCGDVNSFLPTSPLPVAPGRFVRDWQSHLAVLGGTNPTPSLGTPRRPAPCSLILALPSYFSPNLQSQQKQVNVTFKLCQTVSLENGGELFTQRSLFPLTRTLSLALPSEVIPEGTAWVGLAAWCACLSGGRIGFRPGHVKFLLLFF